MTNFLFGLVLCEFLANCASMLCVYTPITLTKLLYHSAFEALLHCSILHDRDLNNSMFSCLGIVKWHTNVTSALSHWKILKLKCNQQYGSSFVSCLLNKVQIQ